MDNASPPSAGKHFQQRVYQWMRQEVCSEFPNLIGQQLDDSTIGAIYSALEDHRSGDVNAVKNALQKHLEAAAEFDRINKYYDAEEKRLSQLTLEEIMRVYV